MSGTTASPPSLMVASGSANRTTLNKRNPFPSLLRSHVGWCESMRAHSSGCMSICVRSRKMGRGRAREVGKAGGSSYYPSCQLWMEPARDYDTFCRATMEAAAFHTHFHLLQVFFFLFSPSPSNKQSFVLAWPLTRQTPGVLEMPSPN